jgi:hypothetical protein
MYTKPYLKKNSIEFNSDVKAWPYWADIDQTEIQVTALKQGSSVPNFINILCTVLEVKHTDGWMDPVLALCLLTGPQLVQRTRSWPSSGHMGTGVPSSDSSD